MNRLHTFDLPVSTGSPLSSRAMSLMVSSNANPAAAARAAAAKAAAFAAAAAAARI